MRSGGRRRPPSPTAPGGSRSGETLAHTTGTGRAEPRVAGRWVVDTGDAFLKARGAYVYREPGRLFTGGALGGL